jgi:F-type H+-transporting ATPase subunit epsilon
MQLEIIMPDAHIFKGEVDAVKFPGKDGSFQVLKDHAPIIAALNEGKIKIDLCSPYHQFDDLTGRIVHDNSRDKELNVFIKGGVMEMLNNKIIVLAE